MDILHVLARRTAVERRHQSPGEHERRVVRAVKLITGETYTGGGPKRFMPLSAGWSPLAEILVPLVANAKSEIRFLAQCATVCGFDVVAPARLPSYASLVAAAIQLYNGDDERARTRVAQAATVYRRARRLLLEQPGADQDALRKAYAFLSPRPVGQATHLGVEPDTHQLLDSMGVPSEELEPVDMFRALFPGLAEDYDVWLGDTDSGRAATATTKDMCLQTLLRVAGWLIRAGDIEVLVPELDTPTVSTPRPLRAVFCELHLDGLFAVTVKVAGATAGVRGRQARRRGQPLRPVQRCLLTHLVDQEATASLARSTVVGPGVDPAELKAAGGRPYITDAIRTNCERVWSMTEAVWRDELSSGDPADAALWGIIQGQWAILKLDVQSMTKGRALPAEHRKLAKNKRKFIRTVTLPQLWCVGIPLRRREIRILGERLDVARQKAIAAGHDPEMHPAVIQAASDYFDDALLPHLMLSLALEDGMRKKQYVRGRPGGHYQIDLIVGEDGTPTGVKSMLTTWTADKSDSAHVKNWRTNSEGRPNREIRLGFVDVDLLWRYLSQMRPRELLAGGAIESLQSYNLMTDLKDSKWALFPSPQAPSTAPGSARRNKGRPDRSRTDFADLLGEELYRIARLLRPGELTKTWDEMQADPEWRSLWSPHITRLLTASYWGGVRGNWDTAMYLTMDRKSTLEAEYAIVAPEIRERTGRQKDHWEHPNAYDAWMDRLYSDREVFDPLDEPGLPRPPHLVGTFAAQPGSAASERKRLARQQRIRRARPGQEPPARRESAGETS